MTLKAEDECFVGLLMPPCFQPEMNPSEGQRDRH